ncbi:MAG: ABC transporter ATP-binding protein [Blautia faecis]
MSFYEQNILQKHMVRRTIIKDISISNWSRVRLVSLLGVSGSGKTTLFHMCFPVLSPPDEGKVYLNDKDDHFHSWTASATCLQKDLLLPHKKVIDNVALPLVLKGVKKAEAREKANPLFAEFGLEGTQYQYPSQLSGGMRQRAALLRTYLSSSGVALLDEPFSALDTLTKASVHKWYLEVMQHIDLSTLFITHDIDEAILLSDRIYILNGTPGTIKDEIVIQERKPRAADFALSEEFLEYKRQIISKL